MSWQIVAGAAGASGVALGAIGSHALSAKTEKQRADWKTASQYQLLHAAVLAALPAFRGTPARAITGSLLTGGITLFSGSIYASILKDDPRFTKAAPIGGWGLILGWLSLAFLKR
jgi:uncharacterized membrane protein YgdD (TMEM256/DUF423 family)